MFEPYIYEIMVPLKSKKIHNNNYYAGSKKYLSLSNKHTRRRLGSV